MCKPKPQVPVGEELHFCLAREILQLSSSPTSPSLVWRLPFLQPWRIALFIPSYPAEKTGQRAGLAETRLFIPFTLFSQTVSDPTLIARIQHTVFLFQPVDPLKSGPSFDRPAEPHPTARCSIKYSRRPQPRRRCVRRDARLSPPPGQSRRGRL